MNARATRRTCSMRLALACAGGIAAVLAGCTSTPVPPSMPYTPPAAPTAEPRLISRANTPREYRVDAANHLYNHNQNRIYHGMLPPQLYAVGVLQVDVDGNGHILRINWMRAPKHAPEVMAEIERTVRLAEPYPAPVRMGRVTYTDTWLWHKSGTFQLDTLTEGQL